MSVLPEIDYSCNTVMPDNGDRRAEHGQATASQLVVGEALPMPHGPFADQVFVGRFDHDSSFFNLALQGLIETAGDYAVASQASHVKVTGHVAQSKLDDGQILDEQTGLAKVRAQTVATALIGLGVDPARIEISWIEKPISPNGLDDVDRRVVEIELTVPQVK